MVDQQALRELGRRLRTCRDQAHLGLDELARRLELKVEQLDSFERGLGGLGMSDAIRLARAVGVPRAAFLDPSSPVPRAYEDPEILLLSHGTATLDAKDRALLREGLVRAGSLVEGLELTGQLPLLKQPELFELVPEIGPSPHASGYERARRVRAALGAVLPARGPADGPVRNLARLLEDHFGILVLDVDFVTRDVTEASCRRGPARLIAVAPQQPESSRRWALAHGLAHQLLDLREEDGLSEEVDDRFSLDKRPREKRADAFAAMFLAPKEAVEAVLERRPGSLGEARQAVEDCRRTLGLGFIPMARQLQNLKLISENDADALVATAGTGLVEGFEEPRVHDGLSRLVYRTLGDGTISMGRARELDPTLGLR